MPKARRSPSSSPSTSATAKSNPDKIRTELAELGIQVEEWGGKTQSQEISAKTGMGIPELLEKVTLEAELLELKANLRSARSAPSLNPASTRVVDT